MTQSVPQTPRARDPRGGWLASLAAALMTGALLLLLAYTQNFHFMPLAALWQPLAFALAVAAGLWLGARLLTRAPAAAGAVFSARSGRAGSLPSFWPCP